VDIQILKHLLKCSLSNFGEQQKHGSLTKCWKCYFVWCLQFIQTNDYDEFVLHMMNSMHLSATCAFYSSDLWALGCIIYQLLSGHHPFWGGSVMFAFLLMHFCSWLVRRCI